MSDIETSLKNTVTFLTSKIEAHSQMLSEFIKANLEIRAAYGMLLKDKATLEEQVKSLQATKTDVPPVAPASTTD